MSRPYRQFIAVLLAVWLPLFSGAALAASVSMQAQRGACHEADMQQMHHQDMDVHQHADSSAAQHDAQDQQDSSCNACGVCHLACSGYLAVPTVEAVTAQVSAQSVTPYLVSFHSITSIPLVPPPLALA